MDELLACWWVNHDSEGNDVDCTHQFEIERVKDPAEFIEEYCNCCLQGKIVEALNKLVQVNKR